MSTKGLFVTFEGRLDTITDSQVFKQIQYLKKLGIEMDLFIFDPIYSNYKKTKEALEIIKSKFNIEISIFRAIRWRIPFSEVLNSIYFLYCIKNAKIKYDYIHSRSEYSTSVVGLLKYILKLNIIWDCRGDTYEEFLLKYQPSTIKNKITIFYSYIVKLRMVYSRMICDNAIFISDELRKKVGTDKYPKRSKIIYNTAPKDLFFYSKDLRRKYRTILGFDAKSIIFIYSGSIVKYQSFPETLQLFKKIHERYENAKLLILTPHIKIAKGYIDKLKIRNYVIKHTKYEDVNNYLNAADIAFLIRKKNAVNNVSSPTKFAEYSMAGLKIIMTDAAKQPYHLSKMVLKNIIEYDFKTIPVDIRILNSNEREKIANLAKTKLSKNSMDSKYIDIYNLYNGKNQKKLYKGQ